MNFKSFSLVNGIVSLLFGLPLLFVPEMMTGVYTAEGSEFSTVSEALSRLLGAYLIAIGMVFLISGKAGHSYGRRGLIAFVGIANLLVTIVHLYLILSAIENSIGWSNVVMTGVLGVWAWILLAKENKLINS